jgi:hypothetical protein
MHGSRPNITMLHSDVFWMPKTVLKLWPIHHTLPVVATRRCSAPFAFSPSPDVLVVSGPSTSDGGFLVKRLGRWAAKRRSGQLHQWLVGQSAGNPKSPMVWETRSLWVAQPQNQIDCGCFKIPNVNHGVGYVFRLYIYKPHVSPWRRN